MDADYDAGRCGLARPDAVGHGGPAPRRRAAPVVAAAAIPQDETFPSFVAAVRAAGAAIEIVSDGLGFYVASNLARLDPAPGRPAGRHERRTTSTAAGGWPSPTATRPASSAGRASASASGPTRPAGGSWSSSATGRATATPPTTPTSSGPRTASSRWGRATGRDFLAWDRFAEIEAWFVEALADGRLPATPADLPAWRATHRPLRAGLHLRPGGLGRRADRAGFARRPRATGRRGPVMPAAAEWSVAADCHNHPRRGALVGRPDRRRCSGSTSTAGWCSATIRRPDVRPAEASTGRSVRWRPGSAAASRWRWRTASGWRTRTAARRAWSRPSSPTTRARG